MKVTFAAVGAAIICKDKWVLNHKSSKPSDTNKTMNRVGYYPVRVNTKRDPQLLSLGCIWEGTSFCKRMRLVYVCAVFLGTSGVGVDFEN